LEHHHHQQHQQHQHYHTPSYRLTLTVLSPLLPSFSPPQILTPPSKEEEEEKQVDLEDAVWMPFVKGVPVRPPGSQHNREQPSLDTREMLLGLEALTVVDEEETRRSKRQEELLGLYEDSDEEIEGETMGQALLRANR